MRLVSSFACLVLASFVSLASQTQPKPAQIYSEPSATMETVDTQLDAAEPTTEGDPSDLDFRKTAQDYAEYGSLSVSKRSALRLDWFARLARLERRRNLPESNPRKG